jgi:hypothetical protein
MTYGSRTVLRFDALGQLIAAYPDIKTAALDADISTKDMKLAVQRRSLLNGSFYQYAGIKPWEQYSLRVSYEQYDPKSGEVVNRFTSLRQAAQLLGVSYDQLRYALNTNRRDPFGHKWRKNENLT